jgi:hypothetical protein
MATDNKEAILAVFSSVRSSTRKNERGGFHVFEDGEERERESVRKRAIRSENI